MNKRKALFNFRPFSYKQKMLLCWWQRGSPYKEKDGIIADGSIRSGKSLIMSFSFVIWAMEEFSDTDFIMAGKTILSFRRNVLNTLKRILISRGYQVSERRSENLVIVEKGNITNSFYIFGGQDESSQDLVQGLTAGGVYFDEAALMPESFVNQAVARCSLDGSKIWMNCNPGSPMHFIKTEWIDKRTEKNLIRIHFMMDDNPALSEKIKQRYKSMYSGVFYRRFVLGEWCVADGLVYPMFNKDRHVLKTIPPDHKPGYGRRIIYYVSLDYGTSNPTAAGLWSFNGKSAVMVKEFYYDGRKNGRLDDSQLYERLEQWIGELPIEYILVDPSAASFITMIRRYAKYIVKGADNDVLDGIRVMTTFLNTGRIFFLEGCTNIQREFGLYSWDEDKVDTVVKEEDHCLDQARYFCYGVLYRQLKWEM